MLKVEVVPFCLMSSRDGTNKIGEAQLYQNVSQWMKNIISYNFRTFTEKVNIRSNKDTKQGIA